MPSTPPRRRGRGRPRGSVYWHAASERWCAQTPPDRRGRRRSRYFPPDQEDAAWAWLDAQLDALHDGRDLFAGTEKLGPYLRRWIARCAADPDRDWSPNTTRAYTWALSQLGPLASLPLEHLQRASIDDLTVSLHHAGRARASINVVRALLRRALEDLVDDGVLDRNPVRRTLRRRPSDDDRATIPPWTERDIATLLATAFEHSHHPALWWLVFSLGLRNGQLRALERRDVDLRRRELTVKATASQDGRTIARNKGKRTYKIHLEEHLVAALEHQLTRPIGSLDRLFANPDGSPLRSDQTNAELRSLCRRAGVASRPSMHACRHWAASCMLMNGYPIQLVSAILGHARASTTLDVYAHVIPAKPVTAPRTMAQLFPWPGKPHAEHHEQRRRHLAARAASAVAAAPAVHSAVLPAASSFEKPELPLTDRYPDPLEAPPHQEEQIQQGDAESADHAG